MNDLKIPDMNDWDDASKDLFYQLNASDILMEFEEWAKENLNNKTSKIDFFEIIDDLIFGEYKEDYFVQLNQGEIFYRARHIETDDFKKVDSGIGFKETRLYGYNKVESREPPLEKCGDQRGSAKNEVALYVADDEITACAEIKSKVRQYISLAEFEINNNIIALDFSKMSFSKPFNRLNDEYGVNVRKILSVLESYFSRLVDDTDEKKYIFSQKIVKHFRSKGINAFKYRSFYSKTGYNYVVFDGEIDKFIWKDSRVLLNYATANLFISLDKCDRKDFNNIDKISMNVDDAKRKKMWNETIAMWCKL